MIVPGSYYSSRLKRKMGSIETLRRQEGDHHGKWLEAINGLVEFAQSIRGEVVTQKSDNFHSAKLIYNSAYQRDPKVIVYCICNRDVRACLGFIQKYDLPFRIRSGGNSFAGFSIEENCFLIDLSKMNHVSVDPDEKTLLTGPGATLDSIDVALNDYGLHLPSGACGDVRISGYMMGGGYGFTSRMFGMNCDNVLQMMVMLADGSIVIANTAQNQDLFWAIRGGTGGTFGILLQIKYRVVPIENVWGVLLKFPIEKVPKVLAEIQRNYTLHRKRKLSLQAAGYLNMFPDSLNAFYVGGMYLGSREEGKAEIASLLEIQSDAIVYDEVDSYLEINQHIWDGMIEFDMSSMENIELPDEGIEEAAASYDTEEIFTASIPFVNSAGYQDRLFSEEEWQVILDQFVNTGTTVPKAISMEAYGEAINHTPSGINAFFHRNVNMNLYFTGMWSILPDDPELQDQMEQEARTFIKDIGDLAHEKGIFNGSSYQNYPNRNLKSFGEAYWGDSADELKLVKQKYDPENFFSFQQSVEGELPSPGAENASYTDAENIKREGF